MEPDEAKAVIGILKTFHGSKLLPKFRYEPPLKGCLGCGHSTALVDMAGEPWHKPCKYAELGIPLDGMRP